VDEGHFWIKFEFRTDDMDNNIHWYSLPTYVGAYFARVAGYWVLTRWIFYEAGVLSRYITSPEITLDCRQWAVAGQLWPVC
jgi:hypothetical protein